MTGTMRFAPVFFVAVFLLAPLAARADTKVYEMDITGGIYAASDIRNFAINMSNAMTVYGVNTATPSSYAYNSMATTFTYGGVSGETATCPQLGGCGFYQLPATNGAYFTLDGVKIGSSITVKHGWDATVYYALCKPWDALSVDEFLNYTYDCDALVTSDQASNWRYTTKTLALWIPSPPVPVPTRDIAVVSPIAYGASSTLTMTSTDATSCTLGYYDAAGTFQTSAVTPNTTVTQSSGALTEDRTYYFQCINSVYTLAWQTATVDVGAAPLSCTLPWGGTLASDASVTAYQSSSVASPATCISPTNSETRTCTDGTLSGTYTNQACTVTVPRVNGSCGTGVDYANNKTYAYTATGYAPDKQCAVGATNSTAFPAAGGMASWACLGTGGGADASCWATRNAAPVNGACGTANGRSYTYGSTGYGSYTQCTVADTSSSTAFPAAGTTVYWTCLGANDGTNASCSASQNAGTSCTLPWGGTLASGFSVIAYQSSSVASPSSCTSQTRTCTNGTLSGTYTNQTCTVTYACLGGIPANGSAFPAPDNTGLRSNVGYSYSLVDTATKCQFYCKSGYAYSGGSCVSTSKVNGTCDSKHYKCLAGSSVNNQNNYNAYSWLCTGRNGGTTVPCSESKVGVCDSTHYKCLWGASTNNVSGAIAYTWTCSNGYPTQCSEAKPLPDLSATVPTPTSGVVGQDINFSATVSNTGGLGAGRFQNLIQVSNENMTSTYALLNTGMVNSLAGGLSTTISYRYFRLNTAGTYKIRACADEDTNWRGMVTESNETNNCSAWTTLTITSPDLTTGSISPVSAIPGAGTLFSATVSNTGAPTSASFYTLFQSASNPGGGNATDIGTYYQQASLTDGGSATARFSYAFPSAGTYYLRACADKNSMGNLGVISESNENNNCGAWTAIAVATLDALDACGPGSGATPQNPEPTGASACSTGALNPNSPADTALAWNWSCGAVTACSAPKYGCTIATDPNYNPSGPSNDYSCAGTCNNGATNPPACNFFPPTATLSSDASAVDVGQSTILRWSSSGALSCTFVGTPTNGISTGGATSGSVSTGALNTAGTEIYQISCTGAGGTALDSVSVDVLAQEATISADPMRVATGDNSTISWSARGVTSCIVSGPASPPYLASGNADNSNNFTENSPYAAPITGQSTFTITCKTNGADAVDSVTVNILSLFKEF